MSTPMRAVRKRRATPMTPMRTVRRRLVFTSPARGRARVAGYYGRYAPLGQELKFFDTTIANTTIGSVGSIHSDSLVEIPQGVTESQRVGRKCTIKSLHLRFVASLISTTTAANADDGLRVIVYHDKQCNGATAAVTDILETADYLSYNNLSNKNRFRILYDEFCDISAQAAGGSTFTTGTVAKTWSKHLPMNLPIEFSATTGAITEIRSNNIGILAISDNGAMNLRTTARVRFGDN